MISFTSSFAGAKGHHNLEVKSGLVSQTSAMKYTITLWNHEMFRELAKTSSNISKPVQVYKQNSVRLCEFEYTL